MTGSYNQSKGQGKLRAEFRRDMTGPVLYAAIAEFAGYKLVKIGISNELIDRLQSIQTGCPVQIGDVAYARMLSMEQARQAEKMVHLLMQDYRSQGEWFKFDLAQDADLKVWRGAIPAVLNALLGKGQWALRSINYADCREAARTAHAEKRAKYFRRRRRAS